MTIRTFFQLIIRIIGLLLLKDTIEYFIAFVQPLIALGRNLDTTAGFAGIAVSLGLLAIYGTFIYFALFRTSAIIDKLSLHKGYDTDEVQLTLSGWNVLLTTVTIVGGWMVAFELPDFVYYLITYFSQRSITSYTDRLSPATPPLIRSVLRIVLGLVIIGYRHQIANLWYNGEHQRDLRKSRVAEEDAG